MGLVLRSAFCMRRMNRADECARVKHCLYSSVLARTFNLRHSSSHMHAQRQPQETRRGAIHRHRLELGPVFADVVHAYKNVCSKWCMRTEACSHVTLCGVLQSEPLSACNVMHCDKHAMTYRYDNRSKRLKSLKPPRRRATTTPRLPRLWCGSFLAF